MAGQSRTAANGSGDERSLWAFAVELYGLRGVREECLSLQDAAAADVDLLLTLLFAASRRLQLDASQVRRLQDSVEHWHKNVIEPLRSARRSIKAARHASADLAYAAAKQAELEAEKVALQMLERELAALGLRARASEVSSVAHANLQAYAGHLALPEQSRARLVAALAQLTQPRSPK